VLLILADGCWSLFRELFSHVGVGSWSPGASERADRGCRERIDSLLLSAGWVLQNNTGFNRNAAEGVAVREFSLPNGSCDYLLFLGGKAAGVIFHYESTGEETS
jgi:hypothetical protein